MSALTMLSPEQSFGSQTGISCDLQVVNPKIYRGVDKLKVSFYGRWVDSLFLDRLAFVKGQIQETESEQSAPCSYQGFDFNLFRRGTAGHHYRLSAGDNFILLTHSSEAGAFPNVTFEFGSLTSQTDLVNSLTSLKLWIARCGFVVEREILSEIHLSADLIGVDIQTVGFEDQDKWIYRANKFTPYYENHRLTGVSLGKGNIMLRVYDKVLEIKNNSSKQEIFSELWGTKSFDEFPVTRIEFQLRRAVLRELNIDEGKSRKIETFEDFLECATSVWMYCCDNWSRFSEKPVDRKNKNQKLAVVHYLWKQVQNIIWSGLNNIFREKIINCKNMEHIKKIAVGCLLSIVAPTVKKSSDIKYIYSAACKTVIQSIRQEYDRDYSKFCQKVDRKKNEAVFNYVPF